MMVIPVPAAQVAAVWPQVARWFEQACHRTGDAENAAALQQRCIDGQGHILTLLEIDGEITGAAILERNGTWLHLTSLGGPGFLKHMADWLPHWHKIAGAVGCKGLSLRGRKGWDRVLEKHGFKRHGEYLEAPSWV